MGSWIYVSVYYRRSNPHYSVQFLIRYYPSRYLLFCSPFSLCTKNGGSIRNLCCFYSLIPTPNRINSSPAMSQCTIFPHILRGQHYLLSSTLSWPQGHASSIFRLPRCLYKMKCSILLWLPTILRSSNTIYLHFMGGLRLSTKGNFKATYPFSLSMIRFYPSKSFAYLKRNRNHYKA